MQQPPPRHPQGEWANDSVGWVEDSTMLAQQPGVPQPESAIAPGPSRRPTSQTLLIALAVAAVVIGGAAVAYLVVRGDGTPSAQQTHTATVTASPPGESPGPAPTVGGDAESTPWDRTGVADAPPAAPAGVTVVRDQQHDECRPAGSQAGGYPVARCRVFVPTSGRSSGTAVPKGELEVACQRDFPSQPNPVYRANQHNTYWVWATSGGEWDWFPETALAEGGSDLPLGQVALCD